MLTGQPQMKEIDGKRMRNIMDNFTINCYYRFLPTKYWGIGEKMDRYDYKKDIGYKLAKYMTDKKQRAEQLQELKERLVLERGHRSLIIDEVRGCIDFIFRIRDYIKLTMEMYK